MALSNSLKIVLTLLIVTGTWLFIACDDDNNVSDGDGDGDGDTDGDTDGDADGDTDSDLSCSEVLTCIAECRTDDQCALACSAEVCGPAGPELGRLLECTVNRCSAECTNHQTQTCQTCIATECPVRLLDCYTASCVPGEMSCGEVVLCLASCGTDMDCATDCRDVICPAAGDVLSGLDNCIDEDCSDECTDLSSPECGNCLTQACGEDVEACMATPCQP